MKGVGCSNVMELNRRCIYLISMLLACVTPMNMVLAISFHPWPVVTQMGDLLIQLSSPLVFHLMSFMQNFLCFIVG